MARAKGRCELCGEHGFEMPDGRTYLETHHIDALGEGGLDTDANVAALCPNDHRQAHFSVKREDIRVALKGIASKAIGT